MNNRKLVGVEQVYPTRSRFLRERNPYQCVGFVSTWVTPEDHAAWRKGKSFKQIMWAMAHLRIGHGMMIRPTKSWILAAKRFDDKEVYFPGILTEWR